MNVYTSQPQAKAAKRASLRATRHFNTCTNAFALKRLLSLATLVALAAFASSLSAEPPTDALTGRWDLTIHSPKGELPSWIEVSGDQGHETLRMVGITDHATPIKTFAISRTKIQFLSPKGEEGFRSDMHFQGKLAGSHLEGTVTTSAGEAWHWTGSRAPELIRKGSPIWGQPVKLFDGNDLNGWHLHDQSRAGTWKVENGMLVSTGHGTELITDPKFEDFKLHVVFKCGPSSNSGVFLRGRYEVQIENDSIAEPNSHHTGGVYGFLDPTPEQPRTVDQWQTFDITLVGRKVTVVQNGITIINNQEIPGITGGALDSQEGLPGPIYLQGSEEGTVTFKSIIITPARNQ
jgi:Domain of Unknown Function (DUF1080)